MKCVFCGGKEKKEWITISPGCSRLMYLCCEAKKDKVLGINFSLHKFKEVTAQFVDRKTGYEYWVDKKGRKVEKENVRYKVLEKRDRFGWKATGKIPKKKTYHI